MVGSLKKNRDFWGMSPHIFGLGETQPPPWRRRPWAEPTSNDQSLFLSSLNIIPHSPAPFVIRACWASSTG